MENFTRIVDEHRRAFEELIMLLRGEQIAISSPELIDYLKEEGKI